MPVHLTRNDPGSPFRINDRALISFSGGRSSGFMLHEILRAHGGRLPPDVHVVFANTGKERAETLDFVHECGRRWGVDIRWLEYTTRGGEFVEVSYETASRAGEPFQALIDRKKRLPNGRQRFCTAELKVQPLIGFMRACGYEPGSYTDVIGLRFDEGLRIIKGLHNADQRGRRVHYPLSRAKIMKHDVMAFWSRQPFDLGLKPWQGNCDVCFMKGWNLRKQIIRDDPGLAEWWSNNETLEKGKGLRGWWDNRGSVAMLVDETRITAPADGERFADEYDVECGLHCGGDSGNADAG